MPMPGGGAGGMPPDPMAGGDPLAGAGDPAGGGDGGGDVLVTICKNDDGSYTVYSGDEPDASADDADAMGAPGGAPPPPGGGGAGGGAAGQPADSIGAALKAALDIMTADKSSEGAPGDADDQLAAGFSADQSPTPATGGPAQKY